MGLFDIFRRHKKKKDQPTESDQPVTSATASEATAVSSETPNEEQVSTAPASASVTPAPDKVATSTASKEATPTSSAMPSAAVEEEQPVSSSSAIDNSVAPVESTAPDSTTTSSEPSAKSTSAPAKQESAQVEENAVSNSASVVASADSEPTTSSAVASTSSTSAEVSEDVTTEAASVTSTASAADSTVAESLSASASEGASEETDQAPEPASSDTTEEKYNKGLEKSRTGFGARLNRFLANFRHVDEDFFDDLEDMLIESDVGYDMAMKLSDELREEVKLENAKSKQDVSNVIIEKMVDLYEAAGKGESPDLTMAKEGPTVIMFVGVNGAGKTTTIGKMAALFKKQGKKVLLAAADTFRAGATEQLDVWAKRDGVDIVTGPENGDPAAVVFDAVRKAKQEDYDILFVDTAGRLQNKVNLMKELAKMKRILTREIPDAPHEVLLVLDATTGQNALNQAKLFKQSTDVTGIVLTKLDGTARGGIVLAIRNELHLPVKYVGLGEKVDDLQKFDASDFVYGLFKGLVEVN